MRAAAIAVFVVSVLAFAPVASAQMPSNGCGLTMTMSCAYGVCTSTTLNGPNNCSGFLFAFFAAGTLSQDQFNPASGVTLTNVSTSLGLPNCFDSASFPGQNEPIAYCAGSVTLAPNASFTATVHVEGTLPAGTTSLPMIAASEIVDTIDTTNPNFLGFAYAVNGVDLPSCTPTASVTPNTLTGVPYSVSWSPVVEPNATYVIEESTSADFSTLTSSQTTQATSWQYQHAVNATTTYFYRVHAVTCSGQPGANSTPVSIVVQGPPTTTSRGTEATVPFGTTAPVGIPVTPTLAGSAGQTFTATTDRPDFYAVSPASGTVSADGKINFTMTANPANLPPGASTGTLIVTTHPAGASSVHGLDSGTTTNIPVSINLVTPVASGGKSIPPANAMIVPVVTHIVGGAGPFVSDVRLTNGSATATKYQVTFTPTQSNGTTTGKITNVTVQPGQTIALNDIAKNFFGYGATGQSSDFGFGALEVRPVNTTSTSSYVSSRTYVTTPFGTYGQFVAGIPFSQFASAVSFGPSSGPSAPPSALSLQQIAESSKFHTNLGLVEGSGTQATGNINVYDDSGALLKAVPFTLQPGEQKQINNFLTKPVDQGGAGLPGLDDGRISIELTSPTSGAVSGYASVLDNVTGDPLAVTPVAAAQVHSTRYVLPGIAEYVLPSTNFHSDMRIFNAGASDVPVTLTFYPSGGGTPVALPAFTLGKGQVKKIDDVLASFFKLGTGANTGGSIVATTPTDSSLVVTGRTFTNAMGGTFGQFIPAVTPSQGIGVGDRPLQILQLEQSAQFRSNVGVAELSGQPARVRMTLYPPDSKVSPIIERDLGPNEFFQFGVAISQILGNSANVYNARISVQVISGSGRVTAYGSVIDNQSTDPTYVPAQ